MSIKLMTAVWDSALPKEQKMIALAYADHADDFGRQIYPSVGYVAWKTGYSERSVQGITRALQEQRILSLAGKSHLKTNLFIMDVTQLPQREGYKGKPDGRPPKEGADSAPTSEDESEKWVQNGEKSLSSAAPKPSVLDPSDSSSPSEKEGPAKKPNKKKLTFKESMVLLSEKRPEDIKIRPTRSGGVNKDDIVAQLSLRFSRFTRIKLTLIRNGAEYGELWKAPLLRMYDAAGGDLDWLAEVMTIVVLEMRETGLDIFSPKSVEKKFVSYCAANQPEPRGPQVQAPEGW